MIYLDNAATTSPKPLSVAQDVYKAILLYSANPGRGGHDMAIKTAEAVYSVRKRCVKMFGIDDEERCIFTPGCTQAINMVLKGALSPGDHLIISDLEHNAVLRPANTLQMRGVQVSFANTSDDDEETLKNIKRVINAKTKLIFVTHASNVTGRRLPVERISALAKEKGILFGIDAAQSAGVLPIDNKKLQADFICMAGHKGLYGVMGSGLLLLGKNAELRPLVEGGTGSYSRLAQQPAQLPERFESGTINVPGIVGLGSGIDFVSKIGVKEISTHEIALCKRLENKLRMIEEVVIHSEQCVNKRVPITCFNIMSINSESAAQRLSDMGFAVRGGLHCSPLAHKKLGTLEGGIIRVSPSVFNTQADIDLFADAVKDIAGLK